MWYPNRSQWIAIWLFTPVALVFWTLGGDAEGIAGRFAVSLLVVGGLVVWRLSATTPEQASSKTSVDSEFPEQSRASGLGANEQHAPLPPDVTRCEQCGRKQPAAKLVCLCGASLLPADIRARLTGPYGWLTLYRFGLFVGGPLAALSMLVVVSPGISELTTADMLRVGPFLLLVTVPVIYGIYVGVALTQSRPTAVSHAKQHLALNLFCVIGMLGLTGWQQGAYEAGRITGQSGGAFISTFIWFRYFGRSRRVLTTFGPQSLRAPLSPKGTLASIGFVLLSTVAPTYALHAWWPSSTTAGRTFKPLDGSYSVQFPGEPKVSLDTIPVGPGMNLSATTALLETADGMAFAVTHIDYPTEFELADEGAALDGMMDGAIADLNSTPLRKGVVSAHGVEGREYVAQTKDRTLWVWGRIFLAHRRGFFLRAVSADYGDEAHRLASERFMNSFQVADLAEQ